jgi:Protein of unknown function (DUF2934)
MPIETMKNRSTKSTTDPHRNLDEEIRRRAYELYESRGSENGHDVDNWLRAEAEVNGPSAKSKAETKAA